MNGIAAAVLGIALAGNAGAAVLYVNANLTTGDNDGSSWADAFRGRLGLQAALSVAPPGTDLWVAQGVYAPAPANGPITESFGLRAGVRLLGGFAGTESEESQRDPGLRVTVLTGDLNQNDVAGSTSANRSDNSVHVVRADAASGSGTLDGFTVRNGHANDRGLVMVDRQAGGGVLCQNASPVIRGCRFVENSGGAEGGGIAVFGGGVRVESCDFGFNLAASGSGLSSRSGASTVVENCRFVAAAVPGNLVGVGISSGYGGISTDPNPGTIAVRGCLFSIQSVPFASSDGVGIAVRGGTARIEYCRFVRCTSIGSGGGVSVSDAEATVDGCLFAGNEARFDGGAALYAFRGAVYTVTNCVFTGNDRLGFSTVHVQQGGSLRLVNCTLFDNGAATMNHFPLLVGDDTSAQVHNCVFNANRSGTPSTLPIGVKFGSGTISIVSSCVEGWNNQFPAVATFAADPLFISPAGADGVTGTEDDDLRLGALSPCIDRGNNTLVPAGVALDLAGAPRFRDVTSIPDLGVGPAPVVDIGAHERVPTCPTDLNGDGVTNTADLVLFLGAFAQPVIPFAAPDLNGDAGVNTADLVLFLGGFGVPCG